MICTEIRKFIYQRHVSKAMKEAAMKLIERRSTVFKLIYPVKSNVNEIAKKKSWSEEKLVEGASKEESKSSEAMILMTKCTRAAGVLPSNQARRGTILSGTR